MNFSGGQRRFWIAILGTVVVLVVLGALVFARPKLPTFQGKDVHYWMLQTRSSSQDDNPGLKAIGTNAIPHLAAALRTTPTLSDRNPWLRQPRVQNVLPSVAPGITLTQSAERIRKQAAYSLFPFGFEAHPALNELHAALTDPSLDDETRQVVIWVLLEIGPPPESLPHLLQAWPLTTNDFPASTRHDLVTGISRLSKDDPQRCLPIFLYELNGSDPSLQEVAAWGAKELGFLAHGATPALERLLSSTNASCQFAAAVAIGSVTNRLPAVVPKLRELALGTNARAAAGAALTLWRWGEPVEQSLSILTNLLTQKEGKGRAAEYLGLMGPAAKSAVPALLEASQYDIGAWVDRHDRARCALAAMQIGGQNETAVHELEAAVLFQENPRVRDAVARELAGVGKLAAGLLPALRRNLEDPDRDARHSAGIAVKQIEAALKQR